MQLDQPFTSVQELLVFAEAPWCSSSSLVLLGESFYGPVGVDVLCCCSNSYCVIISHLTGPRGTKDNLDCPKTHMQVKL